MTREQLEAEPNWQATFFCPLREKNRVECLMRNVLGGWYWQTADYEGVFAWGATHNYTEEYAATGLMADVADGRMVLAGGKLPWDEEGTRQERKERFVREWQEKLAQAA